MGACCSAKANRKGKTTRMRRASTAASNAGGAAAGAIRSAGRRLSRITGVSVGENGAALDPTANISELFTGSWREHTNPDKEARLTAMRLPYMVKKLFMKATVSMEMKVRERGITVTMNFGFIKNVSSLAFAEPDKREVSLLGLTVLTTTLAKRGLGGSYVYTITESKNNRTTVLDTELTPELRGARPAHCPTGDATAGIARWGRDRDTPSAGSTLYAADICILKFEQDPPQTFTCTWQRTGDARPPASRLPPPISRIIGHHPRAPALRRL